MLNVIKTGQSAAQRLVVIGSGWAGHACSVSLAKKVGGAAVTVISPRDHFLFTPLLCSCAVGTLEFRSIIEPVRSVQGVQFLQACADRIDLDGRRIECTSVLDGHQFSVPYDKLAIAVGAAPQTFQTPGIEHVHFLRDVAEARAIRNRLLRNFELSTQPGLSEEERRRLTHVVVVGGGPTGVEFTGELHDWIVQDVGRLYRDSAAFARVTLAEPNELLGAFDPHMRAFAARKLARRTELTVKRQSVARVTENSVEFGDGSTIDCGLVVWSTGLTPCALVQSLSVAKDARGRVLTNDCLQLIDYPEVYAIGDCAGYGSLPATAAVAEREGRYVAQHMSSASHTAPFSFKSLGMMAYLGGFSALAEVKPIKGRFKGFVAWILWRSAYLTMLGNWRSRFQVPLDWFKTFCFGRDTSRFESDLWSADSARPKKTRT